MPSNAESLILNADRRLSRRDVLEACRPLLAEAWVAQRLLTVGQEGLELIEDDSSVSGISTLGGRFSTTIAGMLSCLVRSADPRSRRDRRIWQDQLLRQQAQWPDIAATSAWTYLLCADYTPAEYGLPRQLYKNPLAGALAEWPDFDALLSSLLHSVSPAAAPAWIAASPALREALVTIVSETFKNTHDHARHEVDGAEVAASVRGIYARFYPLEDLAAEVTAEEAGNPALKFARTFVPKPQRPGALASAPPKVSGLLEISMLDSGPGMAAKWLRRTVDGTDAATQYEAVLQCFQKGKTSTGGSARGFGLAKVLHSVAALKGLISVRTNGIHVFRQFGHVAAGIGWEVRGDGSRSPKEMLYDWKKGLSSQPSLMPNLRGTVVSFLLPMGDS